jgi:hypothetical protein
MRHREPRSALVGRHSREQVNVVYDSNPVARPRYADVRLWELSLWELKLVVLISMRSEVGIFERPLCSAQWRAA